MKLSRLPHDPAMLIEFFEQGLTALGAVCDRSWHDRLELMAEGRGAALWDPAGNFVEKQLRFVSADAAGGRDANGEIFPGCPLTFRLAEALLPQPLSTDVIEKLWRAQVGPCAQWRLERPLQSSLHFSLLLLARCEVQAIDQHWSLHRLAFALGNGQADDDLARELDFARLNAIPETAIEWPAFDLALWQERIRGLLNEELTADLASIRVRQENYLRRELERIDDYFENYERELQDRAGRSRSRDGRLKLEQRLAAARAEHERRRGDQVQRHEIRVIPHLDALLLIAEPAWDAMVACQEHREARRLAAHFLPRTRRWFLNETTTGTATASAPA